MKIKRVIAEILALVLFINTLSITTLAENEAQDFIEAVEQEHIEPIMDQWGETAVIQEEAPAENTDGQIMASPENETPADQWGEGAALSEGAPDENADDGITEDAAGEVSAEEVIEEAVIAEAEVVEAEGVALLFRG